MTAFWKLGRLFGRDEMEPGEIDCAEVVRQLYEFIDEELDPERVELVRKHLQICKQCYPRYDFEKAFIRFISEHGRSSAPPGLRRRIFQAILEEESRS